VVGRMSRIFHVTQVLSLQRQGCQYVGSVACSSLLVQSCGHNVVSNVLWEVLVLDESKVDFSS
jgi:hypothetical protein